MTVYKDVVVDGIKLLKGTNIKHNIYGIHHNESQWQKPDEFIPE